MCVDWTCGKGQCRLKYNIVNTFQYHLCKECVEKKERELCVTCAYGREIKAKKYLCKKDNSIVIIEQ